MRFRSLLNEEFEVTDGSTDDQGCAVYQKIGSSRQAEGQAHQSQGPTIGLGTKLVVVAAAAYTGWKIGNKLFGKDED